ncbi:hypothetical protein FACS1894166_03060 [Bacilli bacterium]|nr:hypothetical protein FACS1894166_03060 [Bacilli bacterium]
MEKAIMIDAVCEARANKIARKIIIDQALVTTKKFAHKDAAKYINAVLDKVIK